MGPTGFIPTSHPSGVRKDGLKSKEKKGKTLKYTKRSTSKDKN